MSLYNFTCTIYLTVLLIKVSHFYQYIILIYLFTFIYHIKQPIYFIIFTVFYISSNSRNRVIIHYMSDKTSLSHEPSRTNINLFNN